MDNLGYLFAAYTAIWVILSVYIWHMGRRQRQLEEDFERLEAQLGRTTDH